MALATNYVNSINPEWSLLIITGFIMAYMSCQLFSSPGMQPLWPLFRMAAVVMIALTSLLGGYYYLVTLVRIDGQMLDANVFAITQYIAFFLLLSMPEPQKQITKWVRIALYCVVLFAFFASYSRGGTAAWLGAFGGVVVLSLFKPLFSRKELILTSGGVLVVFITVTALPWFFGDGAILRTFEDIAHLNSRTYIWDGSWELVKDMPWLGYGLGTFSNLYSAVRYEYGSSGVFAHNDYLQLFLEGGPIFLAFLLGYVCFYSWLGFKVLLMGEERVKAERAAYRELIAYVALGLALSAHAVLNYVFYVLSIQILAGMVLGRSCYLACQLGFFKREPRTGGKWSFALPVVVVLLVSSLTVLAVSRKAFMDIGNLPIPERWVKSPQLAETILAVDPDNQAANMFIFNQLFFSLESAPEAQRQRMFEVSFGIGEQLIEYYPLDSDYYWRQGLLLEKAEQLGLACSVAKQKNTLSLYARALELNPGNMAANFSVVSRLLEEGQYAKAKELVETARQWRDLSLREDRKLLEKMAKAVDVSG